MADVLSPNVYVTILVALGSGVLGSLATSVITSSYRLKMQREQIDAERKAELRRDRQRYAVDTQAKVSILLGAYQDPVALAVDIAHNQIDFPTLRSMAYEAQHSLTGLSLLLPKPLADKVIEFNNGPILSFITRANQCLIEILADRPVAPETTKSLKYEYESLIEQYRPIMDEIRDVITEG